MTETLEQIHQMLTGPGHLRFLLQPAIAILLGIREGRRASHAGQRPIDVRLEEHHGHERWSILRHALRRILIPLCLAIGLSLLFQYWVERKTQLVPALAFAVLLVVLPHLLARGLSNRIDRRWHRGHPRKVSV